MSRPYSKEFPRTKESQRYLLDDIPRGMWRRFKAKCRNEKVSMRARLLKLVASDVERSAEAP